ncbi:MAG: hypothetical protein DWH91_12055 [Planctomycetota bacterium]|nr:MAG: hypothetical protein DWH91_12055 [Planctomycetota bacterium]
MIQIRAWAGTIVTWLVAIGVFARLSRDELPWLATIYYATPLPLLAMGAVLLMGIHWEKKPRRYRWMFCAGLLILANLTEDWRGRPDRSHRDDLKVVFWNACRINHGWESVTAEARSWDADVIALVEAGRGTERNRERWRDGVPGYTVNLLGGGLMLLVRGESGESTVHEFSNNSRARQIRVTVDGRSMTLVIVDIDANPFSSRREALAQLAEVADGLTHEPVLILGDFNTPADSALLRPLRTNYRLAFDEAGQGYRSTWPIPFPVLSIDQAWFNSQIEVTACQHLWTGASDHRPVSLKVRPPRPGVAISPASKQPKG